MLKFHHNGIPTGAAFEGENDLPHLKARVSREQSLRDRWQRYWPDAPYPELVKRLAHVAF